MTIIAPAWQPFETRAGKRGHVQHWDSLAALADYIEANPRICAAYTRWSRQYGADSAESAARLIRTGDLDGAEEARALVDAISVTAETKRRTWARAVAGGFPVVPEYLAGSPLCMRRRTIVRADNAPMTIWLGVTVSEGTTREAMKKRAIGAMALALALSSFRQVRVIGFAGMGGAGGIYNKSNFITFSLDADADMAGAFMALAHPVVCRFAAFSLHGTNGGSSDRIPWPWDQTPVVTSDGNPDAVPNIRDALGADPDDLILGGAHVSDSDEICRDPAGWVKKMLAKHGALADQEAA